MKLEHTCDTCYRNHRDCSIVTSYFCLYHNHSDWKPYTNAEHIRDMDDSELADYIMRASGTMYRMICDDYHSECWFDCKTEHHCNNGNDACMPTKEDVLRWLQSEVITDD